MTSEADPDRLPAGRPHLFLMTNSFETGGSERQFVELAWSFASGSFRPRIGCITKRGAFLERFDDEVMEFPVGGNLYGSRSMRARWQLSRYLRRSQIAVAQAFDFYTNLVLIPAARMARVPVILGSQRQLGDLLTPAKRRAQLAMFRWCDRVVCNSRAAAERLRTAGMAEKNLVVIGNGLAPAAFERAAPTFAPSASQLFVGMIARMNTPSKNHGGFLRAAARIAYRLPKTKFILAGDGPLRPELQRQATELGIRDRVCFLGDRCDIPAILGSLDVSVLPSLSESLSNTILESMAAGVPVVACDVGGNPELVSDDRGILVPANDDEALAAAVERLLRDSAMRVRLGCNARKFAESNFTIASVRGRYEDLYRDLLETKTHRRKSHAPGDRRAAAAGRPLRVAIVAASPRYVGGQSVQAELLLEYWRYDPEVEAAFIPIDPALPRGFGWAESVPFLRTVLREPLYLAALWRGLKGAEIAHIFSASYWSFLVSPVPAWIVARASGSKVIIHYHSGEARDHLRRFRTARPILAKANGLIVPSEFLVDVFREFGLTAQAVPNVVDLARFSFRVRKPLRPNLFCTRGFHPYYRADLVVQAFAEVQRQFPPAQLSLAGTGQMEGDVRELVERRRLRGVSFVGTMSREHIAQFYEAADIFVNASSLDNTPVSILEAFAAGTPVVSTAPEGMRHLVEHELTGLLCEPGDARGLAENVMRLLRDPEFALRLAANAHEHVKRYCWTEVRSQWLQIYRSVANGSRH